ncbi:MAG: anti-sigma factor family protein, partial [Geminicoccaceae bacterium]
DLLNRLGAYVDGELSATEAAMIEELVSQDVDIRQTVDELKAANCIIKKGLFEQVEKEPVPAEWIALAESKIEASHSSVTWPLVMSAMLGAFILAFGALTYVNYVEIGNLKREMAAADNEGHMALADNQRRHSMGTAIADENGFSKDQTADPSSIGLSERLSRALEMLRATGDQAGITSERTTTALWQIESLRAALTEASDPIGLIIAEHRLHDHQGGQSLAMIDRTALERISSQVLERSVAVPYLAAGGITFEGGSLVAIDDQPSVHLIYRDHDGKALGLWMMRGTSHELDVQRPASEGLSLVTWSDTSLSYLLIGSQEKSRLEGIRDKLLR